MKVKIIWNCLYSDGENSWHENRFRVLNIDDPDHATDAIIEDYKQKIRNFLCWWVVKFGFIYKNIIFFLELNYRHPKNPFFSEFFRDSLISFG